MKKLFFAIVLTSSFFACKKDTTNPQTPSKPPTSSAGTITALDCGNAIVTGVIKKGVPATGISVAILYTGGDGNAYGAQTISSTGVTGLTATLIAGIFASGNGSLIYTISGTSTSFGTAYFDISIGGKTCTMNLTVNNVIQNPTSGFGPNISDIDGNNYKTVYIGIQQWMVENLKVSKYNDGTDILYITDNTQWKNNNSGAWSYYNDDFTYNDKYGKLYNWYVVSPSMNGNKNVCPFGWHVPTDAEWTVLTDYLGGVSVAGIKLKEVGTANWVGSNTTSTNESLFTGLPGGLRGTGGNYEFMGGHGDWWSSSEHSGYITNSWARDLDYDGRVNREYNNKSCGFSLRCLKD